ncbi:hypothetical protein SeLEV6574_g04664 [Synchytrium endobioticum]|uniref:Uncharacterized protein n=1 Tax=Synchytrium endobioticum TaxID=286115 RepID=A0A507CYC5_9FUNG|nr:hypothetical protein SeLEV6574_g04664 [Synchytrium endobioticum]
MGCILLLATLLTINLLDIHCAAVSTDDGAEPYLDTQRHNVHLEARALPKGSAPPWTKGNILSCVPLGNGRLCAGDQLILSTNGQYGPTGVTANSVNGIQRLRATADKGALTTLIIYPWNTTRYDITKAPWNALPAWASSAMTKNKYFTFNLASKSLWIYAGTDVKMNSGKYQYATMQINGAQAIDSYPPTGTGNFVYVPLGLTPERGLIIREDTGAILWNMVSDDWLVFDQKDSPTFDKLTIESSAWGLTPSVATSGDKYVNYTLDTTVALQSAKQEDVTLNEVWMTNESGTDQQMVLDVQATLTTEVSSSVTKEATFSQDLNFWAAIPIFAFEGVSLTAKTSEAFTTTIGVRNSTAEQRSFSAYVSIPAFSGMNVAIIAKKVTVVIPAKISMSSHHNSHTCYGLPTPAKALVIGANGITGTHIIEHLLAQAEDSWAKVIGVGLLYELDRLVHSLY